MSAEYMRQPLVYPVVSVAEREAAEHQRGVRRAGDERAYRAEPPSSTLASTLAMPAVCPVTIISVKAELLPFLVRPTHGPYIDAGQAAAKQIGITVSRMLLRNAADCLS